VKRFLLVVALSSGLCDAAMAEPSSDTAKQAAALVESGLTNFQAGKYPVAFADFAASYQLIPRSSTAALACQAQANAEPSHPSAAIAWLTSWRTTAAAETLDDKGWRAVQRAHAAIGEATAHVEARLETLDRLQLTLQQKINDLERENRQLKEGLKRLTIDFRGSLMRQDRERLDASVQAIMKSM
jgi:hypothetical protein